VAPGAAPVDAASIELAFWESAERSNSAADYTAYLNRYPAGQFVDLARNRLKPAAAGIQVAKLDPEGMRRREMPVAAPALPREGDFWRYRGSNQNGPDAPTYKVTRVTPDSIEISYVSNANEHITLVLNANWNAISQKGIKGADDIRFVPDASQFSFPLEVGKKWRGSFKGECGVLCSFEVDYEYEVRGWEKVTVPAGSFDAIRIEGRDNYRHAFGITSIGTRSTWLAPEIKHPVKFDYTYANKRLYQYELETYQVAP
jgi:hypothetical protein